MESLEESNCHSLSDNFSLYERYLRSFNVVNNLVEENNIGQTVYPSSLNGYYENSNSRCNIDLSAVGQTNILLDKQPESAGLEYNLLNPIPCENTDKESYLDDYNCNKVGSPSTSQAPSLLDNSSTTADHCTLNDKFEAIDAPVMSEDSKSETYKQTIFITSTMENSNNAVDSVLKFRDVRTSESVFKLPISELSFNGTIKHIQKLKPIVDPLTALSSNSGLVSLDEKSDDHNSDTILSRNDDVASSSDNRLCSVSDDLSSCDNNCPDRATESTGDSQYEEINGKKMCPVQNEDGSSKWNSEQSYSSLEASFDSGVRSPDMFSEEEDESPVVAQEPFWSFLKDYEAFDKKRVKKCESILQGVLPPPSVTMLKTDVNQMLKKYYCFLPAFTNDEKLNTSEANTTPTKRVSFVHIPTELGVIEPVQETTQDLTAKSTTSEKHKNLLSKGSTKSESELDTSASDKTLDLKMCSELEAKDTPWPEVLKCRHYDVYYNLTKYSENCESLALRYGERFVGAETDCSVSVHSGGMQSPSSASKRKALRLAQAKSPGRRLSHLARRRQMFCSAATINEKAQSAPKMVLIDKNFFPHRKLINSSERRSPRKKRTPGKKTPVRKTPGKKTPAKTPKTNSGGSSRKKSMRRLLMDTESMTRSQPTRETLKRALFISPEHRKGVPPAASSSVPAQAMKSKRALFGSPVRAETKSADGSESDQFLKRRRDALDDVPETSRSKIAKSWSFGGDSMGNSQSQFNRRASESFINKNPAELNENHKQKLLWAVSVALRFHGWVMSSPGFREKASALARLTRKLLTLPPHAARFATPNVSTSDSLLKLARLYVFPIIQGRTVEDCFEEEKTKLANESNNKVTGYISASAYQQLKAKQAASSIFASKINENTYNDGPIKQEQPRSNSKNILQDKLVNIDTSSSSSSGFSMLDKSSLGMFKSNSMPSFEEAAKMRARRQISFDNVDFPKR